MGSVYRASDAWGRPCSGPALRGRRFVLGPLLAAVLAGGVGGAGAGCGLNQEGVTPPRNDLFFPAGASLDSSGRWLYVTNSNSDLRYNDGTLTVLDLQKAAADRGAKWKTCPSLGYVRPSSEKTYDPADACCWEILDRQTLSCDSRPYVDDQATVRIGSFAGAMVWQPSCTKSEQMVADHPCQDDGRLFVSVRGNSSVTVVDSTLTADGHRRLSCAPGGDPFVGCDDDHKLSTTTADGSPARSDAEIVRLPEEPYALAIDTERKLLLVGHLRGGVISLVDLGVGAKAMDKPKLVGPYGGLIPPDASGQRGVTSLLFRAPVFYASSRFLPRTVGVQITSAAAVGARSLQNSAVVGNGESFVSNLSGTETRGIQFVDPGTGPADTSGRAFVLQRVPPALVGFRPDRLPVDVLETCNSPTFLDSHGTGDAQRLYVTCFEDGEVYVFDPHVPRLVDIIEVGRGPAGLVFQDLAAPDAQGRTTLAYVVGFSANNISVVDLTPGSPTENHLIQRLGYSSAVPR